MDRTTKIALGGASVLLGATLFYLFMMRDGGAEISSAGDAGAAEPARANSAVPDAWPPPADPASAAVRSGRFIDAAQRLLAGPKRVSDELQRMNRDFAALYATWDPRRFESMFAQPPAAHVMEERIEWFHARLGACGPGVLMHARDELRARYTYECEKGRLEAEFTLDEQSRLLAGVAMGARGIDPIDAAVDAADEALLLTAEWSDQRFFQTFNDRFERDKMQVFFEGVRAEYGTCKRRKALLVSARGALFDVSCERGERTLKIELNDADKIRVFKLSDPPPPDPQSEAGGA